MLELYHWEPNAESLALLVCLKEKGLKYKGHYVDVMKLEQHTSKYKSRSPDAIVPLLVDAGQTMDDTNFALLYLDEKDVIRHRLVKACYMICRPGAPGLAAL